MKFEIFHSAELASRALAGEIRALIQARAAEGRTAVLGLATGKTPLFLYRELVRLHREEGLSFANVVTFNLDEYHGLGPEHPESYWHFMHRHLFDHVDIPPDNVHIPSGTVTPREVAAHCRRYEGMIEEAGGIDLQILGIGRTGHIGFNEPGAGRGSRTSSVHLDRLTRADAAADFGALEKVPLEAITMGCGTILEARRIVLMAWGKRKAEIIRSALQGPVSDEVPASFLQTHPHAVAFLDEAAAGDLLAARPAPEKRRVLQE